MRRDAPGDPFEAALRIAERFDAAEIPYALGGALAYGVWAVPRATVDVDVNVFVHEDRLGEVLEALTSLGIAVDETGVREQNRRQGMFVCRWGLYRIDVFTPSIEFAWEAQSRRVRHAFGDQSAWILSAEVIAVFKLLFFRTKDLADLERLVAVHRELDTGYVRNRICAMMGADDERVASWDRIVAAFRPRT
jgi:hypothetical protein